MPAEAVRNAVATMPESKQCPTALRTYWLTVEMCHTAAYAFAPRMARLEPSCSARAAFIKIICRSAKRAVFHSTTIYSLARGSARDLSTIYGARTRPISPLPFFARKISTARKCICPGTLCVYCAATFSIAMENDCMYMEFCTADCRVYFRKRKRERHSDKRAARHESF